MMPFSVPDVIVSTFLLVRGFALVTVVQFTRGTVIRFSWISITSLEGRRFALNSCELLTEELFLLLRQGLVYGGRYFFDIPDRGTCQ